MLTDYEKSNSIEKVALSRFDKRYYTNLLNCGESVAERQKTANELVRYLCGKFNIPYTSVYAANKPYRKCLGLYNVNTRQIVVYNLTAKQHKVVSIKGFADTLLHEFMHHYDHTKLGLIESRHTTGFYKRISDLKEKVKK
jgi:hypothetical protein